MSRMNERRLIEDDRRAGAARCTGRIEEHATAERPRAIAHAYRRISLRQPRDDDMAFLFRLMTDPARCHLWFHSRNIYDEQQFHEAWAGWTSGAIGAKFLVERRGRPVGLVYDTERNLADGHTSVTALLEESTVGRGAGVVAWALFQDWLFRLLPLRKIYHEVFSYNPAVIDMHRKAGLTEEGVLRRHRFWNGSFWDLHVFAYHRAGWPPVRDRVLRRRRIGSHKSNGAPDSAGARFVFSSSREGDQDHAS